MGALMGGGGGGGPQYGGPMMQAGGREGPEESVFTPRLPTGDPQSMSARQGAALQNLMLQRIEGPPTAEENVVVLDERLEAPVLPQEDPQALDEAEVLALQEFMRGGY